ncbi:MAG: hypothetical protein IBJ17_14860, partial [Reyranella sp.]|nr:hypothetical protein [Reyranella sp.]
AYFATDDVAGWQVHSSTAGLKSVSGAAMQDLAGGTVKVDLWTAIGAHAVAVDLAGSVLDLPFQFGDGGGSPGPTPQPQPQPHDPPSTEFLVSQMSGGLKLSTQGDTVVAGAGGGHYVGQPHDAAVFTADDLYAQYAGSNVAFALPLDAGTGIGNGTQLRLTFDFDGNGTADRTETWQYFETNDAAGWETYTQARGSTGASGAYADFNGGSVTAEVWNAIGSAPVTLQEGAGVLLPYNDWLV